ncbi:hypothetical protein [Methylococcus capsulatus]|uniref:hypothetical protein n=1 Tax=Methylococcus capsulatus TaxID=414 RepID=UPI001C52840E|nr:hypothetical protein [Methylococcus capsulatus]QXP89105.1 hypothetical protein KW114_08120 [Methylococcus capsulatus]
MSLILPHHPAGAAMSRPVDIEHDDGIIGNTEPDKLPHSGTRPDRSGFLLLVKQAHSARFQCREGAEIVLLDNTARRLCAVISLPAPITLMGVNPDNHIGGHMAGNTSRPNQGKITKSTVRVLLADSFGTGNVRITRGGEIHVRGQMPNTNQTGWYLWGQIGHPDTEARLRQLPGAALSRSDSDQLDGTVFDLADRLEMLVILCKDLVEYYPGVRELKGIYRNVKSAHAALEKAKSPVRGLWNLSTESAATEGRSNG